MVKERTDNFKKKNTFGFVTDCRFLNRLSFLHIFLILYHFSFSFDYYGARCDYLVWSEIHFTFELVWHRHQSNAGKEYLAAPLPINNSKYSAW